MFEEITLGAARIVSWLRQHGDGENNEPECRHITLTDEPWEQFSAEYQDSGNGIKRLFVGYYFEQNGDLVPDPNIVLDLQDGKVVAGLIETRSINQSLHESEPDDLRYVEQFLELVWNRHLSNRQGVES